MSQIALTLGVALVLTAMAAAVYRADRIVMTARLVAAAAIVFFGFMGTNIDGRFFAAGRRNRDRNPHMGAPSLVATYVCS